MLATAAGAASLIVVAADGSVRGAVDAMRHGAFDYLLKPCSPELLNAAVQRALSGGRRLECRRRTDPYRAGQGHRIRRSADGGAA